MKGQKEILGMLGELLTAELTAHNLYFVQWQMQENWGYKKLAAHAKEHSTFANLKIVAFVQSMMKKV